MKFVQIILITSGVINLLIALTLLFAPQFFYNAFADFPPYNRHYMGDAGAFLLPLGIGLLIAARDPVKHRALIGLAALGTVVHIGNHLYDDLFVERGATIHWLTNNVPLVLLAIALVIVYRKK